MADPKQHPSILMSPPGARVIIDGDGYDYYGGTGYLGLQGHPEVIEASCRATRSFGVHTATSRSRFANQSVLNVERLAAEFFGTEDAFYFASGYVSNAILVQSLRDSTDVVFVDEASHYSVTEAARLTGTNIHTFAHRDPDDLRKTLQHHLAEGQRPLVMTDGVFPSFGWIAPVDRYVEVLEEWPASAIVVDDAHGFGVLGANGRGTIEHLGLWDRTNTVEPNQSATRLCVVGTTSKALGGYGGIIPGSREFLEVVMRGSHYFDGASAPPAGAAAATARAFQLLSADPAIRDRLRANVARVRSGLRNLKLDVADLPTPIVGFTHGTAEDMRELHRRLADEGIMVPFAASYSGLGPEGAMRLAVFATHTDPMIDRLLEVLARVLAA